MAPETARRVYMTKIVRIRPPRDPHRGKDIAGPDILSRGDGPGDQASIALATCIELLQPPGDRLKRRGAVWIFGADRGNGFAPGKRQFARQASVRDRCIDGALRRRLKVMRRAVVAVHAVNLSAHSGGQLR